MSFKREILNRDEAETLVFNYVPQEFPLVVNSSAKNFLMSQNEKSSDFKLSELIADQSGITDLKKREVELKVETEALEKLKEVQEKAYSEAYELGLIEGRDKAYLDHSSDLKIRIDKLDQLLYSFDRVQNQLIECNEEKIIRLINLIASKIALREIQSNRDVVLNVIAQVFESAQNDEDVVLKISLNDSQFIQDLREKLDKRVEILKNVKIDAQSDIEDGGCILETKYGAIDASLDQRFEKVWKAIESKIPKTKLKNKEGDPNDSGDAENDNGEV